MSKILIIEDELNILNPLENYLKQEGFDVISSTTLEDANSKMNLNPDLVLLDWRLPDGQGIEFLKAARAKGRNMPFIMLTARADLIDKVLGLELGANDYMTKPFEPRELVARIRVQLRQASDSIAPDLLSVKTIEANQIKMDIAERSVSFQNKLLELTKTEFDLLKLFLENQNQVFSREELLKKVWGYDRSPTTRTVDTHVMQLRQKTDPDFFETMHGIGYRFKGNK